MDRKSLKDLKGNIFLATAVILCSDAFWNVLAKGDAQLAILLCFVTIIGFVVLGIPTWRKE